MSQSLIFKNKILTFSKFLFNGAESFGEMVSAFFHGQAENSFADKFAL